MISFKQEISAILPTIEARGCKGFHLGGKTWTSFTGTAIPDVIVALLGRKEEYEVHFVLANGITGRVFVTAPSGLDRFQRPRSAATRVVGYCIEPPEKKFEAPEAKKTSVKKARKTFEAHGHTWFDCSEDRACPEELKDALSEEWAYIPNTTAGRPLMALTSAASQGNERDWGRGYFTAFRLLKSSASPVTKPATKPATNLPDLNADMIGRDGKPETAEEKQERLVKQLVGNGKIFPNVKVELSPLLRVAPISKTGFSLWGAEHNEG